VAVSKKSGRNRRRKKNNSAAVAIMTLLAVLVIGAVLYFAGVFRNPLPGSIVPKPAPAVRQKLPSREYESPPVMKDLTSAVLPPHIVPQKRVDNRQGTIAIIIDDMGSSMREAETLLAMNTPLSISIIPGLGKAKAVADEVHRKGGEVMIHIPMEPREYQLKPFEKGGLLLSMSDKEIRERMVGYLEKVPNAVGANNHMGSRFTEDRAKMAVVLEVLKRKGFFFVDSKTSPLSLGDSLAREMGIPSATRSVFLDNVQDVEAIKGQMDKLAGIARKHGSAIGICHPHKTTMIALSSALPELRRQGIRFVHVSELVR
jgi:uncharacterized protein